METSRTSSDLLLRLLSATELRARVISANIANQNTPGYTRQEVRFEEQLQQVLQRGGKPGDLTAEVVGDHETPARPDGNNVNLELEMNSLRQNRLLYETYAAILASRFEVLRASIENGR